MNAADTSTSLQDWPDRYVVGHRGAAAYRPENTIPSFAHALELGADALEMDVHLTADEELVVTHDDTLNRVTDGSGLVALHAWKSLQRLDAGYRFTPDGGRTFPWRGQGVRIPALKDVLDRFPAARFVLEIKPASFSTAEALADLLSRRDERHRVLVATFHERVLPIFRQRAPGYATAAGFTESRPLVLRGAIGLPAPATLPFQALTLPRTYRGMPIISPGLVRHARARNLHVQVWVVNQPHTMKQLYRRGVNAVTTNYPDRARTICDALKTKNPPIPEPL